MRDNTENRPPPGSGFGLAVALGLPGFLTALALFWGGAGWPLAVAIHVGAQMLAALTLLAWDFRPSTRRFRGLFPEALHVPLAV
ncbi:hypothetical protein [Pararhodobacter sp. CCB-MM2]|uniref:hypothetical protein n=1 Tax=Pararhodobacter sp. CCB-MM2 TaxID=1786003 RepID=UPI000830C618|nr:hypothetical protein [Pararhodobacter sp. CCB-MM2]